MTMKCSERRVLLYRALDLVNALITLNESALSVATQLEATDSSDVADTVNKVLAAGGPYDTPDTISAEIIDLLDGTTGDDDYGTMDWTYEAEA